jgi:large subunit ribosomal protein L5
MTNLKNEYNQQIRSKLFKHFEYQNRHQIPKLTKITISSGLGLKALNKTFLQKAIEEFRLITGQAPILTKAKKSVAGFKIRENIPLGLKVTLRRDKMYTFLEKVIKLVLPRIRDFRGISSNNFDKNGNFNFGITDQLVFPELNYEDVENKRGFNINIETTAKTKKEAYVLLTECGFPFKDQIL